MSRVMQDGAAAHWGLCSEGQIRALLPLLWWSQQLCRVLVAPLQAQAHCLCLLRGQMCTQTMHTEWHTLCLLFQAALSFVKFFYIKVKCWSWDEYNSWQLYHNNPSTYTGTRKQSSPAIVCCFILPLTLFLFFAMISFKVICSYLQQCGCIIDCIWTKDILVCMFSWPGI